MMVEKGGKRTSLLARLEIMMKIDNRLTALRPVIDKRINFAKKKNTNIFHKSIRRENIKSVYEY